MNSDRLSRVLFDRGSAIVLCVVLSPLLIGRALLARFKTGRVFEVQAHAGQNGSIIYLRRFSGLHRGRDLARLIDIASGRLAWVGPKPLPKRQQPQQGADGAEAGADKEISNLRHGLVSVWRLQRMTGSQYEGTNNPLDYPNHSLSESVSILGRYSIVKMMSAENAARRREQFNMLGVRIDNLSIAESLDKIRHAVEQQGPSRFAFVNPDCLNIATKDNHYRSVLGRMQTVFADGIGIRIGCRMLGLDLKDNVNGTDLFPLVCQYAAENKISLFLLGGKPGVAETVQKNMQSQYPDLVIAGVKDGYYDESEEASVIDQINHSGAEILLVAMGAPKQEVWIDKNFPQLKPSVQIGVGGLFDFYSGNVSRSPRWLRDMGLEWTWRLLQEPGRMWKRYVVGNPLFLFRVWKQARKDPARNVMKRFSNIDSGLIKASYRFKLKHFLWTFALFAGFATRRFLDIVISATALLMLSPLLIIVAVLIKLESSGPAIFSQTRVGQWGTYFTMYKFRSMCSDAEARKKALMDTNEMEGGVLFKMKEDPRITKIGKFIRKYSIDELPQFWNVLIGDMSLVGPRPPVISEVDQYSIADRRRLEVKPGITCLWQVSGRSEIPFDEQVELDVDYIESQGLRSDLRILLKTIPAVLMGKGSY